jgi:hypothetical protein
MPHEADDGAGRAADGSPLATFFVGRDADDDRAELAGRQSIEALRGDIAALRAELRPSKTP